MPLKKYAVIDLGSNTFHLLIAEKMVDGSFKTIFRKRVFTILSDGGVDFIKEERLLFGLETLREFKEILSQYQHVWLKVVGTAVLRKAKNRHIFIEAAQNILNTNIEIIGGLQEADYIFRGIMTLPAMRNGTHLIMDIGGGSTEFILIQNGTKIWSNSYSMGVGILYEKFHKTEPISNNEIVELSAFAKYLIQDMLIVLQDVSLDSLTGASGSFEVLQMMSLGPGYESELCTIDLGTFDSIYNIIINSDFNQRSQIKGLPQERVKLIVVGMVLKNTIIQLVQPKSINVSPFALKEGVLSEMAENEK